MTPIKPSGKPFQFIGKKLNWQRSGDKQVPFGRAGTSRMCPAKVATMSGKAWNGIKKWKTRARAAVFGVSGVLLVAGASPVDACAFDLVKPERTTIDWIVEAPGLVLARPDPENPFGFKVLEVLVESTKPGRINQLVDSSLRRRLEANPEDSVLFAQAGSGEWQRIAYVDAPMAGVLETALRNRASWVGGMPQSRLDFIGHLQDSNSPRLRFVAIAELDKVPYARLRAMELRIPTQDLIDNLWRIEGYPYQAIHTLLLGLDGSDAAHTAIAGAMEMVQNGHLVRNLGAFSAAYVELEGADAVRFLARNVLEQSDEQIERIEQVVMALSVHHALVEPSTQAEIDKALAMLIRKRPEAGAIVARQFSLRTNWSQFETLAGLVQRRELSTTAQLMPVAAYLGRARIAQSKSASP